MLFCGPSVVTKPQNLCPRRAEDLTGSLNVTTYCPPSHCASSLLRSPYLLQSKEMLRKKANPNRGRMLRAELVSIASTDHKIWEK